MVLGMRKQRLGESHDENSNSSRPDARCKEVMYSGPSGPSIPKTRQGSGQLEAERGNLTE